MTTDSSDRNAPHPTGVQCGACGRALQHPPGGDIEECKCAPTRDLHVLRALRRHPEMYWGNRASLFDALVGFVEGYSAGLRIDRPRDSQTHLAELVPPGFHEFVWRRIGVGTMGGHGWTSTIPKFTSSDREAFEKFFELREAFEVERQAAPQTPNPALQPTPQSRRG